VYDSHGFSFVYDGPGTYDRQLNLQTIEGCDSIISLHLIVDNQITNEFDTITCQPFEWNNTIYSISGNYTQIFDSYSGCDSVVTCHLEVGGLIYGDTLYHPDCDSYNWHDTEYSATGFYSKVLTTSLGCDSIVYLDLTLSYTPTPKISCYTPGAVVYGPTLDTVAVVTNTEFFSFQYDFYVEDEREHINDWESYKWRISKPSWIIDTTIVGDFDKHYCRVFVAERCDSLVELRCTAYHHCEQTLDSITTIFYLKSSFLDIDEQATVQPDFSVVPNPNNGQMMLNFVNLTERIDIKVFNMQGILIDEVQTYSTASNSTFPYDMKPIANGLYLFVVNGKEGTLTKKVIIE
jgi:hypothetical protein